MSSLFSSKSAKSAASSSSSLPKKGPTTSQIFTVPPAGVSPKKQWSYDDSQLKMVGLFYLEDTLCHLARIELISCCHCQIEDLQAVSGFTVYSCDTADPCFALICSAPVLP